METRQCAPRSQRRRLGVQQGSSFNMRNHSETDSEFTPTQSIRKRPVKWIPGSPNAA
jgi:hypothetical protein